MKFKYSKLFIFSILISFSTFSQNYVYQEEYNDVNGWPEGDNETRSLNVYNGRYYIEYKSDDDYYGVSTRGFEIDFSKDFEMETSIQKISGVTDYGISFLYDYKDKDNYKELGYTSGGYFRVANSIDGKYTTDKSWTSTSLVNQGNYKNNILKVKKTGNKLSFYINDSFVFDMDYVYFIGDRVNLRVYHKQKIAVDYIRIKNISENVNITNTSTTIIKDNFSSNTNLWSTSNSNDVELSFSNGKYYFDHKRASGGWSSTLDLDIDIKKDFKIEATIQKISGIQNNGYGLSFGRSDSDNQKLFYVNGLGSYKVDKNENGKYISVTDWTTSSYVNTGNYATNTLKVIKQNEKLTYYVNGNYVYAETFTGFDGKRFGFIIYDKQKIAIEDFEVSYLNSTNNNNTVIVNNNNFDENILEEFSDNSRDWTTGSTDDREYQLYGGKYYFEHKKESGGYSSSTDFNIDSSKDFEIETKIDKISGVNNYSYGLMWGKEGNNSFRFFITANGYYKIVRNVDGNEEKIIKWTTTSYLNKENGASNILKIDKKGSSYSFYANGNYLTSIDFEPFYGNGMGFVAYNKQKIAIDYLRIKNTEKVNINNNIVTTTSGLKAPFYDDFSSNKNSWNVSKSENYTGSVSNGKLVMERLTKGGTFISNELDLDDSKDFIIETSLTKEKSAGAGLYGITFGRKNSSNEFTFLLSNDGSYMYRKFDNDKYHKIIPFTESSAIKTGTGQQNKIKIVKAGSLLRFYINNQYVNETPFEPFFGNKFGYTLYYNQKISVDFLDVKYQTSSDFNNPPVVVITEPIVEASRGFKIVKTKNILVKGNASDNDGIYEITINGIEARVNEDGTFTANVPLKYGKNDLVIKATDLKQSSSTKKFTIKRSSPVVVDNDPIIVNNDDNIDTNLNIGFGNYYALLIGVSNYGDGAITDLGDLPKKDAQDLGNILIDKYNFKKENVVILNDSPKANDIIREFSKLKKQVTNKDNLLIFYAGHGIYDEINEIGSWLPSDADMEYELNLISNTQVVDYLKSIRSKHTLLISDACFSGSIFKSRSFTKAPKSVQKKYELPSRKAITSGTLKTVPNKSIFLKYLLQRLSENTNKYVSARQLFDRIEEPVMNNSPNTPQYGTIHGIGDEGGDFIFVKN